MLETLGAGSFSTVIKVRWRRWPVAHFLSRFVVDGTHTHQIPLTNVSMDTQARPKLRPELSVVLKETRGVSGSAVTRANVGREVRWMDGCVGEWMWWWGKVLLVL